MTQSTLVAPGLVLRPAHSADAAAISTLIRSLSHLVLLHPDGRGAEPFLASIGPAAISGYITDPRYCYQLVMAEGELAGVLAVRDGSHLFHLFIAPAWQGRGLGARVLTQAMARVLAAHPRMTVNASLNAISFYAKAGFVPVGEQVAQDGVAFLPMALDRHPGGLYQPPPSAR
ncbi:GNAT family N-acetyltransferase [Chitinimonas sp.]|uniref:GNAT family N-acetyltransferase n=1 Tax=Chitinimonas sp. TaxID=1934313 RepID=UPI002F92A340